MTLDRLVERLISKYEQQKLLLITSLIWAYVAAGVMVIAFTLGDIKAYWNLDAVYTATLGSATFLGMLLGALTAGLISDYFGRKRGSQIFLLISLVFSILSGYSPSPKYFFIFRVISGFGFGGLLPSVNTYLSEFLNIGIRGKYLVLLEASWAIGSIYIGLIDVTFSNIFGWSIDYIFLIIGLIPFLFLISLPESPKFLYVKKGKAAVEKVFKIKIDEEVIVPPKSKITIFDILKKEHLKITLVLWFLWFVMSFGYYGIFVWIKNILAAKGIGIFKASWYVFFTMLAQLPGYLSAAYLIEKWGRRWSYAFYLIGTGISALFFAFSSNDIQSLLSILAVSFFCLGAWGITYAYTPELYPTSFRGTANGSAGAATRIGGILAPYYTGFFLERSLLLGILGMAVLFIFSAILVLAILPETKEKEIL